MRKELTIKAPTVEEAENIAFAQLGVSKEDCEIEIIEAPKKSLFGKIKGEAVVKVSTEIKLSPSEMKLELAKEYLTSIVNAMGLKDVTLDVKKRTDGTTIVFNGESIAVLIGHHGETLDALQYLVALNCNQIDGDYYRITLDCGNYRDKREVTLKELANRIAIKVKKTGKSQLLEPMNPYERRIIHSIVTDISGVCSKSKGDEPNRRVVILPEVSTKAMIHKNTNSKDEFGKVKSSNTNIKTPPKPYVHKPERTMEEILKNDFKENDEDNLYGKIEF